MKTIKTDALKGLSLGKARKRRKAFADPVKIAEAAAKAPLNNFQPDLKLTSRKIESLAPAKRRVRAIKPEQIQGHCQIYGAGYVETAVRLAIPFGSFPDTQPFTSVLRVKRGRGSLERDQTPLL